MFRLCVTPSANKTIFKVNIRDGRYLVKFTNNLNLINNGAVGTIEASSMQFVSDCKRQSNETISVSNNNIQQKKEKGKKTTLLIKEDLKISSEQNVNESEALNKFKILGDLKSFPILGSKVTDNYGIECVENNINSKIPTVAYILIKTLSVKVNNALKKWKQNMISTYGKTYFNAYYKGVLNDSKLFHSCIRNVLLDKDIKIPVNIKSVYFSVQPILSDIQKVYAVETNITHPTLRYKGSLDCIATYRGEIYVINWKKSGQWKASLATTFDAPIQLAAYIGAINASNKFSFKIHKGLIVIGYTNGEPASVYELKNGSLQEAWKEWLRRLEEFYTKLVNVD
ncbi:PREDICTED: mitochondrial genome maintenance exonuclease 1-like [Eufriesea mexicana]|uniref:mitochondrial genome maintenance exonuclease 1-like n=1 Tax=Eufriesea mexicana TaxID=516756 RepID=UPI00083C660E|nr:PREDICTED: mitochondrial genome maintenance exonuclease 1-like [Eufriesea mexicana]